MLTREHENKLIDWIIKNSMPKEQWRQIDNTSGRYYVSTKGRVLSMCYNNPKLLKPYKKDTGYVEVKIRLDNRENFCHYNIHRLVAKTFKKNPDNLPVVHHKDHNRSNNNLDNLEWVSYSENNSDRIYSNKTPKG